MGGPEIASLDKGQSVDSVMRRWPATIRVFLDHGMLCVGCPIGRLHTIEEACVAHGIDLQVFLERLSRLGAAAPVSAQAEGGLPSATRSSL